MPQAGRLRLSQVARHPIDCCNGDMRFTSCWYQRARETMVCRAQGKKQVGSGHLNGQGMKAPARDWVGEAGSALPTNQPPSHPAASLLAKQWAQERRSGFLCTRKQPLLVFLTPLPSHAHVLGAPGCFLCQRTGLWERRGLCVEVISVALLKIKQKLVYNS